MLFGNEFLLSFGRNVKYFDPNPFEKRLWPHYHQILLTYFTKFQYSGSYHGRIFILFFRKILRSFNNLAFFLESSFSEKHGK